MLYSIISLANKLRDPLKAIQESIEKISSKIDSATAEYKAENAKNRPAPVVTAILNRPQAEIDNEEAREAHEEQRNTREEGRDRTRLIIEAIALCIGVVTLGAAGTAAYFTYRQWGTMNDTYGEVKAQTKASATATCIADQTLKRRPYEFRVEERPYVALGEFHVVLAANPAGENTVNLWFVNSGRTPAINFFLDPKTIRMSVGSAPMDINTESTSRAVIAPGRGFQYISSFQLNEPFKTQYEKNQLILQIKGVVTYTDIFDIPHWTVFCGQRRHDGSDTICGEKGSNRIDHEDPATYATQKSCTDK